MGQKRHRFKLPPFNDREVLATTQYGGIHYESRVGRFSRLTGSEVTSSSLLEGVTVVRSYVFGCTIGERCYIEGCEMRGVLIRSWGSYANVRMRDTATPADINIVGGDYSDRGPLSARCGRWLAFEGGPGMMQVGCERHSLAGWLADIETIANAHEATRFEIEIAKDLLAQIIRWQLTDGWIGEDLKLTEKGRAMADGRWDECTK